MEAKDLKLMTQKEREEWQETILFYELLKKGISFSDLRILKRDQEGITYTFTIIQNKEDVVKFETIFGDLFPKIIRVFDDGPDKVLVLFKDKYIWPNSIIKGYFASKLYK